jgi:aryl-alcohol dehydrogenase-like predicted oxidoreductase
MKERKLGKTGPAISEIGLGCWQLGADWGDPMSESKAFSILREAVTQGITLFDTADVYGQGKSETLIGEFLKSTTSPVTVITKFGRGGNLYPDNYSEKALFDSVTGSLERLGLTSLELLQLHCVPQEILVQGDIFIWLRKCQNEGLIKNFGASVETVEQGLLCMEQEGLLSLQVIFNIFRQKLLTELLPQASDKGVGIIVRLPLASGLLSGNYTASTRFSKNDHRNYNRNGEAFNVGETFAGLTFEKGLDLTNRIRQNFLPEGMNMVQLALRWILDHEAVSCIIPGASRAEQVVSNAAASELDPLPKELHDQLYAFYLEEVQANIRGAY